MSAAATIQLVTPDLTHQETILQIVDALDHLDKVTDEVFANIQTKIDQNATKLANLDSRVDVADQKVKALAQMSQKATCIYSSAKYPEKEEQDYVSAFKGIDQQIKYTKNTSIKIKKPDVNLKGLEARDINEKRRYFHLPVKKKPTTVQLLEENPDLKLPSNNARSALSYLIFNTADNPYAKRKDFSNPLNNQKANKTKKEEDEGADKTALGEAPVSLGIGLDDVDGTADLFFAPALGDLPDLDLPDILDLPNLPTDLSYMTDLGPGIAPSVQQIPDFPDDDGIPEDAEALLAAPPPPPPPSLIPPPPQPTSAPVAPVMPALVPELTTIPKLELPPVPPVAPVAPPPLEDIPDASAPRKMAPAPMPDGGGRAGLMEAIRNAGGSSKAGLKSVMELKKEEKKAKQEVLENPGSSSSASGGGGGDLMSDLASKLAMRRKGISGKPEGSTMDKMSMMIPTLPEDPDDAHDDDDDDDWS